MLRIGETIDRYRIEALIGQGGMAAVYKARHLTLESEHAIKVLFITAPLVRSRLLREGRVQANLRHPNIVSVTDVLEVQGAPALVMEYIDGPALDAWLRENHPTLDQALWLFRGILRGISVAHERGVVHRDLKPANVLLAPRPEGFVPKVTDFGLVKSIVEQQQGEGHTQTGMSLGTPEYMSPEQIRDASDVDQRADMWALGCILYELVCHRRAFAGPDKMSTFNAIVAGTYEPIEAGHAHATVAEAIQQLLVVDRDKRLSSTDALFQVLYEESEPRLGRLSPPPKPVEPLLVSGAPRSGDTEQASSAPPAPRAPGGLGEGPTGRPAQLRFATPIKRDESPLSGRDTAEIRYPHIERSRRRLVGFSVGAGLALLVAFGWWMRPVEAVEVPDEIARTAPGTPKGQEVVAPVTAPTLVPAPDPKPPVAARPSPRDPAPRPPVPTAAGPKPAGGTASVTFSGDAKAVWLESKGRRVEPGPAVSPGLYTIVADFGDPQPAQAGTVEVRAGEVRHFTCNASFLQCRDVSSN